MYESIVGAIRDNSFPDSEETLSSDLNLSNIPSLLEEIQLAKKDLNDSVCNISKEQADDVDGWISQAKRVQQDILRCKTSFKYILDEHSRIDSLRAQHVEARAKTTLLEEEITFNETLQNQILLIADTSAALNQIDEHIHEVRLLLAAQTCSTVQSSIDAITGDRSRSLFSQAKEELSKTLRSRLDTSLNEHVPVEKDANAVKLGIIKQVETSSETGMLLDQLLDAFALLEATDEAQRNIVKRLESNILPYLHRRSKLHIFETVPAGLEIEARLSTEVPSATTTTKCVKSLLTFIHQSLPSRMMFGVVDALSAQIIPLLIVTWLDPALPPDLEELQKSHDLQEAVKDLADWLNKVNISQGRSLTTWVNQIPRTWLSRRRASSLIAVRNALRGSEITTRKVERVERQVVSAEELSHGDSDVADAWADNWDDDDDSHNTQHTSIQSTTADDDGSDAWGFDAEDRDTSNPRSETKKAPVEDDEADAWGWGEDDNENDQDPSGKATLHHPVTTQAETRSKNASVRQPKDQELTLSEQYTVTSIPDQILACISHDTADFETLQSSAQEYFRSTTITTAPSGMQSLPTLVLSMFRAIAPDHYSATPSLSLMNLYNDTLYLIQVLTVSSKSTPSLHSESDSASLQKFARQVYTSELTTQRTILHDLLDNAQGFTSCTVEPYLGQCDSAIASTTDYIRSLHSQWSKILSPSHLSQSIGSLLNSIMSKMIKDIEDIEDISEAQSQKLIGFMEAVSKLEDLFATPSKRDGHQAQHELDLTPTSTIAIHVPSYLRFQYLSQILEGSLADIRYLWTDAGLGLEFTREEVVDLIEALFAESSHRRNAIQAIRA